MAFRFESLEIWKISVDYAIEIYKMTDLFPKDELFGLVSQLRRAAISISSCIAEGSGATTIKDYHNFLNIAVKSALEVASLLFVTERLGHISQNKRVEMYEKTEILIRRIRAFKKSLK